ncbi:hypothetical protein ENUP19_0305G0048 [Entamoeba nuttalli]|uniref:GTP-binding protein, Ras family protein n=2 Tax=Entamoeba nuttalli TaxID=412467 RepID=K2H3N1_ENTNP|nr:GTP-binding protein, Ras family protein [Entamoeba nuttalli P19]EKE40967.1 GTP-binding protein, Ras family protein [Entamoeba nuttalli P19]|eukprot:XP_008856702.1 GTP-binding protein, Ras family protein [Entamoeba nuttalli P19]
MTEPITPRRKRRLSDIFRLPKKESREDDSSSKYKYGKKSILFIGDLIADKNELVNTYLNGKYLAGKSQKVDNEVIVKRLDDEGKCKVVIMTCEGEENYPGNRKRLYEGRDIVVLTYAVDNLESFKNIEELWLPEVAFYDEGAYLGLIGTHGESDAVVTQEEVLQFAKNNNIPFVAEVSSKNYSNIDETFFDLILKAVNADFEKKGLPLIK